MPLEQAAASGRHTVLERVTGEMSTPSAVVAASPAAAAAVLPGRLPVAEVSVQLTTETFRLLDGSPKPSTSAQDALLLYVPPLKTMENTWVPTPRTEQQFNSVVNRLSQACVHIKVYPCLFKPSRSIWILGLQSF